MAIFLDGVIWMGRVFGRDKRKEGGYVSVSGICQSGGCFCQCHLLITTTYHLRSDSHPVGMRIYSAGGFTNECLVFLRLCVCNIVIMMVM